MGLSFELTECLAGCSLPAANSFPCIDERRLTLEVALALRVVEYHIEQAATYLIGSRIRDILPEQAKNMQNLR